MLRFVRRDARPFDAAARSALRPYDGVLAELLYARGVTDAAQAERFLHPQLTDLRNPLEMSGMPAAVALLEQARAEGWRTVVYGDYDADGVCAAAIATEALRLYGINAQPHIPLRAEGYGLNLTAVESLARDYQLLMTVDLGITNAAEVARARELGLRVLVTDHHQPGLYPCPADAVVNPLLGKEPFSRLCGAGVAYQLASALLGADVATQWLDLAAFATVADIVPLLEENRVLVALGLPRIGERPGLRALMDAAGCRAPLSTETVAYQLAPRINAAGRIADANVSVRLLLTRDPAEAEALARRLDAANTERKRLEAEATAEASAQAETHDFVRRRMLFVRGKGWSAGVVGLVAGKLNRRFGVPVCAFSDEGELLHGSLRGIPGVNLARCLQTCDDLLLRYGGHEMAAGVTLNADNDDAFRERLERAVRGSAGDDAFVPAQAYDLPLSLSEVNDALLDALLQLEPFGCGNPAPVFLTGDARLERRRACGSGGAHLQITLRQGDRLLSGIAFGMGAEASRLPDAVDAAYTLAREEYMGAVAIKCHVEALRPEVRALAAGLVASPDAPFESAFLRALRDGLNAFPPSVAGNTAPDAEVNKAISFAGDALVARLTGVAGAADATGETSGLGRPEAACMVESVTVQAVGEAALVPEDGFYAGRKVEPDQASVLTGAQIGLPTAADVDLDTRPGSFAHLPMEMLLEGRQGSLFVAYARETAMDFLTAYGERVDLACGAPGDPRCFHTLLIQPDPLAVCGRWQTVVLLDGALTPADVTLWRARVPGAAVLAAKPTQALRYLAAAVDAGDARYRALYRLLRGSVFGSLRQAAAEAGLSEAQTLAGLTSFAALELLKFSEVPFFYNFRETRKCSLADSPVLGALRALHVREEGREC